MNKPAEKRRAGPARNLHSILARTPEFSDLEARLEAMLAVQKVIDLQWPALQMRVLSVRGGVLALATPNAALAAKARQSEPSMLAAVRRVNPVVQEVRFKPEKHGPAYGPAAGAQTAPARSRQIGEHNLEQLQLTASQLEDGPVRRALQRLIRRQLDQ